MKHKYSLVIVLLIQIYLRIRIEQYLLNCVPRNPGVQRKSLERFFSKFLRKLL